MLYPKVSTGQEKLVPTGLHGLHVFATLLCNIIMLWLFEWLDVREEAGGLKFSGSEGSVGKLSKLL